MTNSFVHTDMATEHTGVLRVEAAAENLKSTFTGKGVGQSLVLAAIVAAVLVAANRLIDSVAGGSHWIAGWALLWAVAFVAIALLAAPARNLSSSLRALGITVRSAIDVLLASLCIERGFVLLHRDRDFDAFETHRGLRGWAH